MEREIIPSSLEPKNYPLGIFPTPPNVPEGSCSAKRELPQIASIPKSERALLTLEALRKAKLLTRK